MEIIKIKYFNPKCKIEKTEFGDWIDLRAAKTVTLNKGDYAQIPLGVAMQLPAGYEAHVVPRSSTFKNWGIIQTNSMGIIDQSYCGNNDEWQMPVYATRDTVIEEGQRICQFRIERVQTPIIWLVRDKLNNPDRSGFGSTGKE